MSQVIFFSSLDYGAKRPEGQTSVSQVPGSLAGTWASGDLVCPQVGVGPGIFLLDVICPPAAAAAAGQVYYSTTNTAVATLKLSLVGLSLDECPPFLSPPENTGF